MHKVFKRWNRSASLNRTLYSTYKKYIKKIKDKEDESDESQKEYSYTDFIRTNVAMLKINFSSYSNILSNVYQAATL